MWMQTMMTCRFCKEHGYDHTKFVQYGVRHYAHHRCYLAAGKQLDALHDWQIAHFPYRLIAEFDLEAPALAATLREKSRMEGDGAPRHTRSA